MVSAAEFLTYRVCGHTRELSHNIYRNLAHFYRAGVLFFGAYIGGRSAVGSCNLLYNAVNRDRLRLIVYHYIFNCRLGGGYALWQTLHCDICLHFFNRALKLTDIIFKLFGNVLNYIVRQVKVEVFCFSFYNSHSRFKVGRLNVCNKSPLKAVAEPVLKSFYLFGRKIRGENYLIACRGYRVKGVEKFLLRGIFARDKLNVVNQKHVRIAVFIVKICHILLRDIVNKLVCEIFTARINYVGVGVVSFYLVAYGVEKVGFAEAGVAVNKQRVICSAGVCGNRNGGCVSKFV